jgi:hypothetical protein
MPKHSAGVQVGGRVEGVRAMFEERVGLFGSEAVRSQPFHTLLDALLTPTSLTDVAHRVEASLLLHLSLKTTTSRSFPSVSPLQLLSGWSRTCRTPSLFTLSTVRPLFLLFSISILMFPLSHSLSRSRRHDAIQRALVRRLRRFVRSQPWSHCRTTEGARGAFPRTFCFFFFS